MKGLSQKQTNETKALIDTENSMVITREKGMEGGRRGYGGINGDGKRPDWGGDHTMQYTHDYRTIHLKPI